MASDSAAPGASFADPGTAPAFGVLAIGLLVLCLLFLPEGRAAVATWNASTAYGHCYLVLPMAVYLGWERRDALTGLRPQPSPGWALLILPVAAGWLLAERLGIMEGRQLLAMTAIEALFLSVLGWTMFRLLLGPFLFLLFLVPFGAFLTPSLQNFTAAFAVAGLNVLHIPNVSDSLTIEIPAGVFYVAEACAGLRFLIAAVAFGVFYALLNYRSPGRRLAFIAASLVIPVIANGFRALGIVVLGQVLGSAEAAAADHVIYGWVFFSFVLLLLVLAGLPLREAPLPRGAAVGQGGRPDVRRAVWAAMLACVLAASGPVTAGALNRQARAAPFTAMPALTVPPGCRSAGPPPALPAIRADLTWDCGGTIVEVAVQTFPARATAAALLVQRRIATGEMAAEDVSTAALHTDPANGGWTIVATEQPDRVTAFAAWVDGAPAQGGLAGRLRQARASLLGGAMPAVLMTVSLPPVDRLPPERRRAQVDLLHHIVDAQSGLTDRMADLVRLGGS